MKTFFTLGAVSFISFLFLRFDVLAFFAITFSALAVVEYMEQENKKTENN